jgi:anti-sigma B factor antagonist
MSTLNIKTRRTGDVSILDLEGQIRLGETNINLHNAIKQLAEAGEKKVLLNLAGVSHIDSSGLGELVAGFTSIERSGGDMKLVNLADRVIDLMTITKLHTVFEIFDNESQAVESFGGGSERATA